MAVEYSVGWVGYGRMGADTVGRSRMAVVGRLRYDGIGWQKNPV